MFVPEEDATEVDVSVAAGVLEASDVELGESD